MKRLLTILVGGTLLFSVGYLVAMSVHKGEENPYAAWQKKGSAKQAPTSRPDGVPVVTAAVSLESLQDRLAGTGVLEAEREVTIIARVDGEVKEFAFEEGARVEAGSALCVIDEEPLEIALRAAKIDLDYNRTEYERLNRLAESSRSAVTTKEVDDARVAFQRAEIAFQEAKLRRSYAQPKSPFAGVVIERMVEKGSYVRAGDELIRLGDLEPLLLRVHLPERDIARIAVNQSVELRSQADGDSDERITEGRVLRVSPIVDRESLTVEVVTSFEAVPSDLRPGSFGRIAIITRVHNDVILIPRGAIVRSEETNETFAYRITAEQRAERVPLTVGFESDAVVEAKDSDLKAGDIVVVDGSRTVKEGDRVHEYRRLQGR